MVCKSSRTDDHLGDLPDGGSTGQAWRQLSSVVGYLSRPDKHEALALKSSQNMWGHTSNNAVVVIALRSWWYRLWLSFTPPLCFPLSLCFASCSNQLNYKLTEVTSGSIWSTLTADVEVGLENPISVSSVSENVIKSGGWFDDDSASGWFKVHTWVHRSQWYGCECQCEFWRAPKTR